MDNKKKTIFEVGTPFEVELFYLVKKYPSVRSFNVQKNKKTGYIKTIITYDNKSGGQINDKVQGNL